MPLRVMDMFRSRFADLLSRPRLVNSCSKYHVAGQARKFRHKEIIVFWLLLYAACQADSN